MDKIITLDKVKVGHFGIIFSVGGEGAIRRRLLDMGLTPGTKIMVRKIAPLGDPIEVFLRSYELTPPAGGRKENRGLQLSGRL